MPSFAATDLPLGSVDGRAPSEAGWLARQTRRMLVLAGLIAGCWLLASILSSAHASAAPMPVPATSVAKVSAVDTDAKILPAARPVRALVAAVPTTLRTLPATVQAVLATVTTTTHQVSTIVTVVHAGPPTLGLGLGSSTGSGPAAGPAGPANGASAPTHRATVRTRTVTSTTPNSALAAAANRVATPVHPAGPTSQAASTAVQGSATRPASPQRPTHLPSPGQPGAAGTGSCGQTFGGTATHMPTPACAPTSFMVSARTSQLAALLRSSRERPSVSPD